MIDEGIKDRARVGEQLDALFVERKLTWTDEDHVFREEFIEEVVNPDGTPFEVNLTVTFRGLD